MDSPSSCTLFVVLIFLVIIKGECFALFSLAFITLSLCNSFRAVGESSKRF